MSNKFPQNFQEAGVFSDLTTARQDHYQNIWENDKCPFTHHNDMPSLEFLSSMTETQPFTPIEPGILEYLNDDCRYYHGKEVNLMNQCLSNHQKPTELETNELQEVLNSVPSLPVRFQPRIHGRSVNIILIATSLDQQEILEVLGNTLHSKTTRATPLLFIKENT